MLGQHTLARIQRHRSKSRIVKPLHGIRWTGSLTQHGHRKGPRREERPLRFPRFLHLCRRVGSNAGKKGSDHTTLMYRTWRGTVPICGYRVGSLLSRGLDGSPSAVSGVGSEVGLLFLTCIHCMPGVLCGSAGCSMRRGTCSTEALHPVRDYALASPLSRVLLSMWPSVTAPSNHHSDVQTGGTLVPYPRVHR